MSTIMITGAGGLIGKTTVEYLISKGVNVIAADKIPSPFADDPHLSYIQCSITDKDKLTSVMKGSDIDAFVHMACTVDNDFPDVLTSAEEKTSAAADKFIYKAAEGAGVGIIMMISTHQIYGNVKTREPIRETADEKPVTTYAKIKSESEKALAQAVSKSKSRGVIMRICPVYTKDYTENLLARVYDKKECCAYLYGSGDYTYAVTNVYNIADFVLAITMADKEMNINGIYNVCDSTPVKAREIVDLLKSQNKITTVTTRQYLNDTVKKPIVFGAKSTAKAEYRYNDYAFACSSINYDTTKAKRVSTLRWKLSNTK